MYNQHMMHLIWFCCQGVHLKGKLRVLEVEKHSEKYCVLVAGCYVHCATPCMELSCFDMHYVLRFDMRSRLTYAEKK